jgi:hypothetical protein
MNRDVHIGKNVPLLQYRLKAFGGEKYEKGKEER